jgi:hypothetical protein
MTWLARAGEQQLGPLSETDLQAWAKAGRLRPSDLVWRAGMPAWLPAAQVPEFASQVAGAAYVQSSSVGDDPVMRALLPVGRSGWAIAAGYLGLFSVLLVFAPLALLTGFLAIREIRRNPKKHGMGRAVFGIVMGVLGTAALIFVLATRS